jgi:hypothetical protein
LDVSVGSLALHRAACTVYFNGDIFIVFFSFGAQGQTILPTPNGH